MGEYVIQGGHAIRGEYAVIGAKNAALPILAAAAMGGAGKTILHGCPDIADVQTALAVLRAAGCKAELKDGTAAVDAEGFTGDMSSGPAKEMRGAVMLLGAALGVCGRARIARPGGCELGARPIDLHVDALTRMGARVAETDGMILAETDGLRAARIPLKMPSVGATEQVMIAAALAEGETVLTNAAREPEIVDLQAFLNAMGARVAGAGSGTVVINGVKRLRGAAHKIIPDRIVAGTFLCAAAMTGGEILMKNAAPEDMRSVLSLLAAAGARLRATSGGVWLKSRGRLKSPGRIQTGPHPDFPTDMAPQFAALLASARGASTMVETVFEARGGHVEELRKMGADMALAADGRTAAIRGVERLRGATVDARDLRGGAALILAGLAAEGETIVRRAEHVARGYERIERALASLGADILLRAG